MAINMKKITEIIILFLLLTTMTACGKIDDKTSLLSDAVINVILYSGEDDGYDVGETELFPAEWNLQSGTLAIQDDPVFIVSGQDYFDYVELWDGNENYMVSEVVEVLESDNNANITKFDYQSENKLYYCRGYTLEITDDQEFILTDKSTDKKFSKEHVYKEYDIKGSTVKTSDCYVIGSYYDGEILRVFYCFLNPDGSHENHYLFYVTISLESQLIEWSEGINVPSEYHSGLFITLYENTFATSDKFYFSGWNTIVYLDLLDNKIKPLNSITDVIDNMIPGAKREVHNYSNDSSDISFTSISGNSGNTIICYLALADQKTGKLYVTYYAIKETTLLGVIQAHDNIIDLYDADMNRANSYKLDNITLRYIPFRFQRDNYGGY